MISSIHTKCTLMLQAKPRCNWRSYNCSKLFICVEHLRISQRLENKCKHELKIWLSEIAPVVKLKNDGDADSKSIEIADLFKQHPTFKYVSERCSFLFTSGTLVPLNPVKSSPSAPINSFMSANQSVMTPDTPTNKKPTAAFKGRWCERYFVLSSFSYAL